MLYDFDIISRCGLRIVVKIFFFFLSLRFNFESERDENLWNGKLLLLYLGSGRVIREGEQVLYFLLYVFSSHN